MTPPGIRRDRAMDARVGRTLTGVGLDPAAVIMVQAAHRLAMDTRRDRLLDAHHPDFLHPGRTVLVLALDCGFRNPIGLAAAALLESEHEGSRTELEVIRCTMGDEVADWVGSIPVPGPELAEALLGTGRDVQVVALAERLDQCRHAKFWTDVSAKRRILEEVEAIYGPVAERTLPALGRRFAHWSWAFGRSLDPS